MDERRLRSWLDGELGDDAAEAFLASLSDAERREARALAEISAVAARLPKAEAAADFTARTMARVRTRRPPRRSLWVWLRAPALSPFAAFCGALLVAAGAFAVAEWRGAVALHGAASAGRLAHREVVTRLAYRAPLARTVAVAADFNGWKPEAAAMRRGENGLWTVEIPLPAGRRYEYMFVVDGRWVTDPDAPASVDDGFGGRNALLQL